MITHNPLSLEDIFQIARIIYDNDKPGFLSLLQLIFSIPTVTLLIIFLKFSCELRDFCGFSSVPYTFGFTRFKQDFLPNLQAMFDRLVDLTEPICQHIYTEKASMVLFDTSGIEAWVTENNPKYVNWEYDKNTRKS